MGQMTTIPVERLDSDKACCVNFAGVDFAGVRVEGEPSGSIDAASPIRPAGVCGVCAGLGSARQSLNRPIEEA